MPNTLEFRDLGEGIGNATAVLRNNAAAAGLDAPVPTCPGWTVRDLVTHQGLIHRWATANVRGVTARPDAEVWATDCPLAAIQFEQHAGRKPMHPMSILARAYRGEPFPGAPAAPKPAPPTSTKRDEA